MKRVAQEHSELILCRAPHLDVKTWQVASPPPQNEATVVTPYRFQRSKAADS